MSEPAEARQARDTASDGGTGEEAAKDRERYPAWTLCSLRAGRKHGHEKRRVTRSSVAGRGPRERSVADQAHGVQRQCWLTEDLSRYSRHQAHKDRYGGSEAAFPRRRVGFPDQCRHDYERPQPSPTLLEAASQEGRVTGYALPRFASHVRDAAAY